MLGCWLVCLGLVTIIPVALLGSRPPVDPGDVDSPSSPSFVRPVGQRRIDDLIRTLSRIPTRRKRDSTGGAEHLHHGYLRWLAGRKRSTRGLGELPRG